MNIYQIDDYDWWIGESLTSCVADYLVTYGNDVGVSEARELTDEELDSLIFTDTYEDDTPTGTRRTFREQLAVEISIGGEFPRMFASTEV